MYLLDKLEAALCLPHRFILFVIVGGSAALINLGLRYLANFFFSFEVSVAVAYVISMAYGFTVFKLFVFKNYADSKTTPIQMRRFTLVALMSFSIVWAVSMIFEYILLPLFNIETHSREIAHFFGVSSPIIVSYYAHRSFTFSTSTI